jgi:sugar/nucleoside kinase (ribokinase family)
MSNLLVIGAVALDRPVRLEGPLRAGSRLRGRTLAGGFEGRLGGGGANAGCALLAAGHAVMVGAILAGDDDGRRVRALAEQAGLDLTPACTRPGASSRTVILLEPSGERTILVLDGVMPDPRPGLDPPDRHPEVRPDGLYVRAPFGGAADWARATAGPVILHWPSPGYGGEADVVVASAEDLPDPGVEDPFKAAASRLGPRLEWLVVTHGAEGAVGYGRDGARISVSAPPAEARDATAAGDVFAAGLLDALVAGADMQQALGHACVWGASAVGLDSSAPVDAPAGTFRPWSGEALAKLA